MPVLLGITGFSKDMHADFLFLIRIIDDLIVDDILHKANVFVYPNKRMGGQGN